jgi:hypothetical protein
MPREIREQLAPDESLDDAGQYVKIFLGGCFGIGLRPRGKADNHICFTLLVEDDEHWFPSCSGGSSSWLEDVLEVTRAATNWCLSYAVPDMHNGRQYGWKFPEGF